MLKIGKLQLSSNLLLAPIAGYCDLAFRMICREQGGLGLACTDLLSPQGLLRGSATSLDLARTNEFDRPVGMQLYGCDPEIMAEGARWARDHGASLVDINMGCPVDKVTKKDGGSRLLCIPETAEQIVEAVVKAVGDDVPVTCKMRLGWFNDQPVAKFLAPKLVRAGARAVTIHGRTTEQKFTGVVSRAGIREVVEAVRAVDPGREVPVIGNGDVVCARDVLTMIEETGCDGVMIGRGALSRPWIFRDAFALQTRGELPAAPTREEIIAIVLRYFELMLEYRGEHYALHHIRRRISWFAKPLGELAPGEPIKGFKEAVRVSADAAQVREALGMYAREGGWGFGRGETAVASADSIDQ